MVPVNRQLFFALCSVIVVHLLIIGTCWADAKVVGRFSAGDLAGWQEQVFRDKAKTRYAFVTDGGKLVLAAVADKSASGYRFRIRQLKAKDFPMLRWSWKISHPVVGENPDMKSGDDFAARVYVVFPGRFFWQTRAICYVWSGVLSPGTMHPSPFTANVVNIAVASGVGEAGRWRSEVRNYVDDYKRYFGADPPNPEEVAIMTDTDNTGGVAEAWYGDIAFVSHR